MRRDGHECARLWRRTLVRYLAVLVGLTCVVVQFSTALHMLLVEHVSCAEHGGWVHADEEHAAGHEGAHDEVVPDSPALAASDAAGEHRHEHCLLCPERRKLALPAPVPDLHLPAGHDREATLVGQAASTPPASIHAYAPKTSPPA
ncbi:MAG: hypothetical protein OXU20_26655 [Myxococcales bacterium]|nr:hypothetical protein [Myxococcales bacterium]MDD9971388.1 hypothetical protein [Myxococcales bacterium]